MAEAKRRWIYEPNPEVNQRISALLFYMLYSLSKQGKIDTTPLITHRFALKDIEKAYEIFENKLDGVIKIAVIAE